MHFESPKLTETGLEIVSKQIEEYKCRSGRANLRPSYAESSNSSVFLSISSPFYSFPTRVSFRILLTYRLKPTWDLLDVVSRRFRTPAYCWLQLSEINDSCVRPRIGWAGRDHLGPSVSGII